MKFVIDYIDYFIKILIIKIDNVKKNITIIIYLQYI